MQTYPNTPCAMLAGLLVAAVLVVTTITPSSAADTPAPEILDNASIITLKNLGLGENLIVDKINISKCEFDTSVTGLKALTDAAVPQSVIKAMLATKSGAQVSATAAAPIQATDLEDPRAPHEAGIWLYDESSGKGKMTQLEPSVYSQAKTGNMIFAQFGQTTKSRAVVASPHAALETAVRRPVFYFYFEKTQTGLSGTQNVPTSPNEYILAQFEVSEKDHQRSLVLGQFNAYSGNQSGAEGRSIRAITFEKLAPGIYKVLPREDLANGEYAFYYAANATMGAHGTATGGKLFDFSIHGSLDTEPSAGQPAKKKSGSKPHA